METIGNVTKLEDRLMQRELGMLAEASKPRLLDDWQLAPVRSMQMAIALCIQLGPMTCEQLAEALHMSKGHLSKCSRGRGNFPPNRYMRLMELCGNLAPLQFMARSAGFSLFQDARAQRKAELLEELKRLEAA